MAVIFSGAEAIDTFSIHFLNLYQTIKIM